MNSVAYSGNADIDGVLGGVRWSDATLTYSFASLGVSSRMTADANVQSLSATQQAAIRDVLKMAASVTSLTFTEVADSRLGQGTIRFGQSPTEATASAYYPSDTPNGGDAWFNAKDYNSPKPGNYAFMTMLHETGHTLGLDHGHEGAFALPGDHDSIEYSVMTYRSYSGSAVGAYSAREGSYPRSYMLDDLAALQYMYGANYGTNAGNTTYRWNPSTGAMTANGVVQGAAASTNTVLETIWDGGGTDTYDFSAYRTGLKIDINPGAWTTTSSAQLASLGSGHVARGNIANAYLANGNTASLIENVKGGSGADEIIGNVTVNKLHGGGGKDTLYGGGGSDILKGGSSADRFVFNTALGPENVDKIKDFAHNSDVIALESAIFKKVGSSLSADEFYASPGVTAAHDKSDRIVYNPKTGDLFYDPDGSKAGESFHFATLTNRPTLDHGDFIIV